MKVLKPGRKQRGWSVETKCTGQGNGGGGCGAELLVEQPDLFRTTTSCRDETDHHVTFKCCACGVLTDLKGASEPPWDISNALPNQRLWEAGQAQRSRDEPGL